MTGGIYNIEENYSCENSHLAYSFHHSLLKPSMFSIRSSLGTKWHCSAEGRARKAREPQAWKGLSKKVQMSEGKYNEPPNFRAPRCWRLSHFQAIKQVRQILLGLISSWALFCFQKGAPKPWKRLQSCSLKVSSKLLPFSVHNRKKQICK